MAKYVIIGNSTAAIGCVEGIRSKDKDGEIVLIASENHHTYARPLISYLLQGKTDEERMKYRPDSFYEENHVTAKLGETVTKLDPEKKNVTLKSGEEIPYEKLLVATGSTPFVPPMEGLDTDPEKFTFMSLDDAHALESVLTKDSRVLIIGAGLIGLKCAEGIKERVKSITVVDLADRVLPSILDETGSAIVKDFLEKQGIEFHLGDTAAKFAGTTATLRSGLTVDFDVLVIAVGVRPNTSLVKDAGGEVRRGIAADDTGKTTLPDVYAAGDCAESFDISAGVNRVLALLPNAYMQGNTAGINMAGGRADYTQGIALNASGVFGLHMVTAGSYEGESFTVQRDGSYKRLVTADGVLKGVIMVGDVSRAGIYTDLIRKKKPLSEIDFDLIRESPQLMAFSQKDRRVQLGGEV